LIQIKNSEQIEKMRESNAIVGDVIAHLASLLRPGITTRFLDEEAGKLIARRGAVPSFLHYHGYPFNTCISVNDAVVHGFPDDAPLKAGDIVSIDAGAFKNGYHGDSAYTFALKDASPDALQLLRVTKEALYKGIEKAIAGNRLGDVAWAIQEHTEKLHGFGVVRELVGHGIGSDLHEDPQVPNVGKRGNGVKLQTGMTLAIEPMINLGRKDIYYDKDGWTVRTKDGKPSAHFEHSLCVMKDKAELLSSFEAIEAAERANPFLESQYDLVKAMPTA
jgi:methionyl aminopeptidase